MGRQTGSTGQQRAWKLAAGLPVVLMGAVWLFGQDLLDQMSMTITPVALVLPLGAAVLCASAWWVRNLRRRAAGWETAIDSTLRRDEAMMLTGLFALGWVFAFLVDRLGHTPHQTFGSAAVAAMWDSGGIVCLVFCGACLFGGGRR